jgi:predicted RNA binding protein YcfA (HicA-like mRNA interferase family)
MSPRLPQLNAKDVIRALERADFFVERSSGSHHLLVHRTDPRRRATVAYHGCRDIPQGTCATSCARPNSPPTNFWTFFEPGRDAREHAPGDSS